MKNICFQMNRKAWLAIVMVLCLSLPALAQKITVTGTVVDATGEPLIGASVLEQGTAVGTATDIDGNYSISVSPKSSLVVSYVGYNTQTIPVNGRTTIDVTLTENTVVLNEVVAIGYGVVKKSDATGSVAMVKPDDIEAGMATSAQDLLVGASPGVVVTTNGGDPTGNANIRIRGGSSLSANNNPLIVIDGVPMNDMKSAGGTNALSMVNPQNIESMTILKDASATAIYGSRASNGVIIITTKKGKSGKPQINFAANFHVNTARNQLNMMKSAEYREIIEKYGSDGAKQMLAQENADTDWQKVVTRTSFSQDYSLSIGGSLGNVPYRVNASWTDNQGILETSSMQRTTVGLNLSPKFFNGQLSINANVNGSYVRTRTADTGAVGTAVGMSPTYPVYKDYPTVGNGGRTMFNGYYNITTSTGQFEAQASQNPLQMLYDQNNIGKVLSSNGNLQIDYALYWVPELHFNLNLGYQVSKNNVENETAQNSIMAWRAFGGEGAGQGTIYKWYELQRNTLLDFYINYRKDFKAIKSNLDVMVGYSWQHFDYHGNSYTHFNTPGYYSNFTQIYSQGVYDLSIDPTLDKRIGQPYKNAPVERWGNPLQLVSFFGRLNYSFDDTYLLTFTLRDDGTSRFSKDNRWGLFPSLALGWKIINMPFMESAHDWMNDFKLRLGWGKTGQQDVGGEFPYMPLYTQSYQQGFQYLDPNGSGQWINPLFPASYNPDLKWETNTTWNVGLDLAFLNNRITVALDWYKRISDDLLAYVPVAFVNTENMMNRNIGSLENNGFEVTIGAKPIVTKDFTWNTSVNFSYNDSKITKLTGAESQLKATDGGAPFGTGQTICWNFENEAPGTFLVYEQVYDDNNDPIPGMYVDQNGDGLINESDMIKYHSRDPKFTATWNNTFNYKNWDFGISLRANFGNYVYNGPKYNNSRIDNVAAAQYMLANLLSDTYLFEKTDSKLGFSSYFVENASFVRCDNITIGYTWPDLLKNNLSLRLFGAVQNPFVITKYKGLDPEVFTGVDNSLYPRPITATIGLVATF
ncbi:MAG: TonB-dependent receptor [Muribaculaceae bacterium]